MTPESEATRSEWRRWLAFVGGSNLPPPRRRIDRVASDSGLTVRPSPHRAPPPPRRRKVRTLTTWWTTLRLLSLLPCASMHARPVGRARRLPPRRGRWTPAPRRRSSSAAPHCRRSACRALPRRSTPHARSAAHARSSPTVASPSCQEPVSLLKQRHTRLSAFRPGLLQAPGMHGQR